MPCLQKCPESERVSEEGKMECRRALVAGAFLFLWVGWSVVRSESFLPCAFPAIYSFGDSTADTGGLAAAFDVIPELDRKRFTHSPHLVGRASDGRLIIDLIAEHVKLPHLSAYLDSLGANFQHGANFASGGATIRKPNGSRFRSIISPFSLDVQILQFNRFKERSKQLYDEAKTASDRDKLPRPEDFAKALYTFDIGQNDIHFGLRMMSFDELLTALPDIINQFALAIKNLYHQGARAFWIHNMVPLGCLPASVLNNPNQTPEYFDEHGCVKEQNDISIEFNRQLKERVIELRAELLEAAITYVDVYSAKYALTSNAKNLGYEPFKFWYRFFEHNDFVWCGDNLTAKNPEVYSPSCEDSLNYVSWDGGHYSDAANRWVANHILNGSLSDPPIPITQACRRQPSSIDKNEIYGASTSNMFTEEPEACSHFL